MSPDFLASDYCYDVEMTRTLERHGEGTARVIQVISRPCEWHQAPFGKLLATPTDGKAVTKFPSRDDAFLEVTKAIHAAAQLAQKPTPKSKPRVQAIFVFEATSRSETVICFWKSATNIWRRSLKILSPTWRREIRTSKRTSNGWTRPASGR